MSQTLPPLSRIISAIYEHRSNVVEMLLSTCKTFDVCLVLTLGDFCFDGRPLGYKRTLFVQGGVESACRCAINESVELQSCCQRDFLTHVQKIIEAFSSRRIALTLHVALASENYGKEKTKVLLHDDVVSNDTLAKCRALLVPSGNGHAFFKVITAKTLCTKTFSWPKQPRFFELYAEILGDAFPTIQELSRGVATCKFGRIISYRDTFENEAFERDVTLEQLPIVAASRIEAMRAYKSVLFPKCYNYYITHLGASWPQAMTAFKNYFDCIRIMCTTKLKRVLRRAKRSYKNNTIRLYWPVDFNIAASRTDLLLRLTHMDTRIRTMLERRSIFVECKPLAAMMFESFQCTQHRLYTPRLWCSMDTANDSSLFSGPISQVFQHCFSGDVAFDLDISNSYPSTFESLPVFYGHPTDFKKADDGILRRTTSRYIPLEYRFVMDTVARLSERFIIQDVFSNFHVLNPTINGAKLDLLVKVLEPKDAFDTRRSFFLGYNFHAIYSHGYFHQCSSSAIMRPCINGSDPIVLGRLTNARDAAILRQSTLEGYFKFHYSVVCMDCTPLKYPRKDFYHDVSKYKSLTVDQVQRGILDGSLTGVFSVSLHLDTAPHLPILHSNKKMTRNSDARIVASGDLLRLLIAKAKGRLTDVDRAVIFRSSLSHAPMFKRITSQLARERNRDARRWIKFETNKCLGLLGYRPKARRTYNRYRLVYSTLISSAKVTVTRALVNLNNCGNASAYRLLKINTDGLLVAVANAGDAKLLLPAIGTLLNECKWRNHPGLFKLTGEYRNVRFFATDPRTYVIQSSNNRVCVSGYFKQRKTIQERIDYIKATAMTSETRINECLLQK